MAHIDWITIVGRRDVENDWTIRHAYQSACEWLEDNHPAFVEAFGSPLSSDYEIVKPRAPYSYARRSTDCTRTLYVHPLSAHFTFEASGQHCQRIAPLIPPLLAQFYGSFSRLDVAVDMECATTPADFAARAVTPRITTRSVMVSPSGETVYIGSRSSERFTRVYRYKEPHPRARLLRAEFQLKGDYANELALQIGAGVTLGSLAAGLGEVFGFRHPSWKTDGEAVGVRVPSHAQSGNTIAWLTSTIAPLLQRLEREKKLDVRKWFEEYVTNQP